MKCISIFLFSTVFFFANAQTTQTLLAHVLVKKEQSKFLEGIQLCNQVITIDSTIADAYFYKAGFHTALIQRRNAKDDYANYKAAIANYTKVISLNPTHAEAFFFRGGAHDAMQFIDEALKDYQNSIDIDENQPKVYNSMGVCFAKKGKIMLALAYFDKAIALDSTYAKAYANRGNVYDMKQDLKNACKNWKTAIALGYLGNKRRYEVKCKQQ
ncbi:tetratricopeptide repeat protein [Kordia jejudonensis]|uniref:tetratricopeptide repeat protein n=1 Tax=Kordia jejudonensis TaxID=1348245 RepID=UPI0006291F4B|nr:hypothetical protein [Kordia jejudonensis]